MAVAQKIGVRALQQNAGEIIRQAIDGQAFEVTSRGQDTGVRILLSPTDESAQGDVGPTGATLGRLRESSLYSRPQYKEDRDTMLSIVETLRDSGGTVEIR